MIHDKLHLSRHPRMGEGQEHHEDDGDSRGASDPISVRVQAGEGDHLSDQASNGFDLIYLKGPDLPPNFDERSVVT